MAAEARETQVEEVEFSQEAQRGGTDLRENPASMTCQPFLFQVLHLLNSFIRLFPLA